MHRPDWIYCLDRKTAAGNKSFTKNYLESREWGDNLCSQEASVFSCNYVAHQGNIITKWVAEVSISGHAGSMPNADQCWLIKIRIQELIPMWINKWSFFSHILDQFLKFDLYWSALGIDLACPGMMMIICCVRLLKRERWSLKGMLYLKHFKLLLTAFLSF